VLAPPSSSAGRGRRVLPIAAVLAAALALRLAHWAAVRRAPFIAELAMDSREYDRWAREIAGGDWLGHGVFFQAPLYPYLLALLYKVCGRSLDAAYLVQIAGGVAGCYALYRAGRAMVSERVGLAAAALAAVYGPFIFYDVQLLKESLAATVACFLLWALALAPAPGPGERSAAAALARTTHGPSTGPLEIGLSPALRPAGSAATGGSRGRSAGSAAGWPRWLLGGLLLGVLALLRENALLVVPFLLPLPWIAGRDAGAGPSRPAARRGAVRTAALGTAALLAGVCVALAPVALRNGLVGGDFLPTTFQGGVNFYIGNNPRADGTYQPIVPGKQVPELERREPVRLAEQELGRRLTPAEVSRFWLGRALGWARSHPGDFLRLTLRKLGRFFSWYEWPDTIDYYAIREQSPVYRLPLLEFGGVTLLAAAGLGWLGGGRARRLAPALLFAGGWMVSTVAFFLFARYRLPVVPALLLLAALPVAAFVEALAVRPWLRGRAGTPAADLGSATPGAAAIRPAILGVVVAAAFALPRLAGFAPRLDLVHFNLGRLAEERGDAELAGRHYRAVLAVAPGDFLAWLDLGNLAARRRDLPEALRCYRRAAALEPASDDAQSNLGGVYLALGDLPAASRHLERALALDPQSVQALQNGALLRLRLGDAAGARELNRRALAIDPTNPAALRLRARLPAPATPASPAAPGKPPGG
jgi:4-amino-4-deoxy-L-arabinose transferase-like glycosyltransferase